MEKYTLQQTRLAKSFVCIADKCPATCCSGWNIVWTRSEAERLGKVCTGGLSQSFGRAFPKIADYNSICIDEENMCPFLCEGLCEIHRSLGAEYLSYTCREYPRITRLVGDVFIKSCKTTCYAVAELLVTEDDCMEILTDSADGKSISAVITSEKELSKHRIINQLSDIILNDNNEIREALIKGAEFLGIGTSGSTMRLDDVFRDIFGWSLSLSHKRRDATVSLSPKAESNIIKSLFLEWRILRISEERPLYEDYCGFVFSAAVMLRVMQEARLCAESMQEYVCTVSDIAGLLYSDKSAADAITEYLSRKKLNSIEFMSYMLI